MAKKVFYDDDARERVLGGARALYDAVKVTYGPKGRNVVIAKGYGGPTVTHDGVTVAESVDLPEQDDETLGYKVGAELIKQAAQKLNKAAGDGTTTVTVLTYNILKEANRLIAAGHNPMELRKGIEAAATDIIKQLDKLSEDIEGKTERVAEVATISAGDAQIGKLIASVIEKVGKDGVVTVEASQGLDLEAEVVEGFNLDKGWSSPFFVTDAARQEAVYEKPAIVITDKKISSVQEFLPLIEGSDLAIRVQILAAQRLLRGEFIGMGGPQLAPHLPANPEEKDAACKEKPHDLQQLRRDGGKGDAHDRRGDDPQKDRAGALLFRQTRRCKADDDGIVACKREVDANNLQQRREPGRRENL